MKKRISVVFLLAALCIFSSNNAFAAWTQAKGHSYNQLGFSYYKTTEKFTTLHRDASGTLETTSGSIIKEDQEKFTSKKISYYGEYGITDKVTLVLSVPYDWQRSNDTLRFAEERGPSGVGDINLGLRYQLVPNLFGSGVLMSAQGEVKIPEAYKFGHPLLNLSQGDGQYDTSFALKFGRGLPKGYLWLDVGYKYRFENDKFEEYKPSDQFKVAFGGGYPIVSWLSLTGYLEWSKAVGNARVSDELVVRSFSTGLSAATAKDELIKDTLSLEKDDMSVYVGLQFNLPAKHKAVPNSIVVSYARDIEGFGEFKTKNNALGKTIGLALVYIR
ncbi:MAG: hypothetical protein C4526_11625 [Nitrospiraceae bacterium]|nr:MAG: hypothetical protein C4526_11625 [Nitrospiraceae bacterium]